MPQLTKLQVTPGAPQRKASLTLAVVHRLGALPALRQASSDNFVAALAIKELTAWGE